MKSFRRNPFVAFRLAAVVSLFAVAGCSGLFVPRIKVIVDSISAPGAVKPTGQSYRLVGRSSVLMGPQQASVAAVAACVKAALNQQGMFEAPAKVAPDLFIDVSYGRDTSSRVSPRDRETFLELSARANPERAQAPTHGAEVWNVRTSVLGATGRLEDAMPLLATVGGGAVATNTHAEVPIEVPQNSPAVAGVRDIANQELAGKAPAASAAAK
jgi:hypothetical protein